MPNWISNSVMLTHDNPHKLKELADIFEAKRPFNTLVPQPDWPNTPASEDIRDFGGEVKAKKGELPEKKVMKLANGEEEVWWNWPSSGRNDDRWYDWCRKHWGTKWDTHDVDVEHQVANNMLILDFQTPWCPPDEIFHHLRKEKGFEFLTWEWSDECAPDEVGDLTDINWDD